MASSSWEEDKSELFQEMFELGKRMNISNSMMAALLSDKKEKLNSLKTMGDLERNTVRDLKKEETHQLLKQCHGIDLSFEVYKGSIPTLNSKLHCCVCGDPPVRPHIILGTEVRGYLRSLCNRKCLMKAIEADTPEKKQHMKCMCFHVSDQQQPTPTPSNPDFAEEWINE